MATRKPATPSYNPTAQYSVQLADRVDLLGQAMYPGHEIFVRGDVLQTIDPEKVKSATPIDPQA